MAKDIARTIYEQLGGNRFMVMTGCKNFVGDENSLRMSIPRNHSKANRLTVTYDYETDTYQMRFWKFTPFRFNTKTGAMYPEKFTDLKVLDGAYCDMLQSVFTDYTQLYTRL